MHQPTVLVGVTDHLGPEEQAMLLAQYSRSYGSILSRVPDPTDEVATNKLLNRLRQTYNGDGLAKNYGHKSVGQLGHTTIFFEGVSLLAAIAIEVTELFNGQESSTRYIPYDNQPAVDCGDDRIRHWQEVWRLFYKSALERTIEDLKTQYPMEEGTDYAVYFKTIKARAFDICGGILPAGFTTCVGFTGSFDVLNDHICWMAQHPLQEVRDLAWMATDALVEKYPNAAFSREKVKERSNYQLRAGLFTDTHVESYYYREGSFEHEVRQGGFPIRGQSRRYHTLRQYNTMAATDVLEAKMYSIVDDPQHPGRKSHMTLNVFGAVAEATSGNSASTHALNRRLKVMGSHKRNKYEALSRLTSSLIRFNMTSQMDFRSYRDVHRHRNGHRPLPLLGMANNLHLYYLDNLNDQLREKFQSLYTKQREEFYVWLNQDHDPIQKNYVQLIQQYAIPMASEIPYYYECDLNQLIYMLELRTDKTVHQTVRIEMFAALDQFRSMFTDVLVHADETSGNFTLKRGTQTFQFLANPELHIFSVWRGDPQFGDYENVAYNNLSDSEKVLVNEGKLLPELEGAKETWPRKSTE
jgi:thymidylate synthase ThyX